MLFTCRLILPLTSTSDTGIGLRTTRIGLSALHARVLRGDSPPRLLTWLSPCFLLNAPNTRVVLLHKSPGAELRPQHVTRDSGPTDLTLAPPRMRFFTSRDLTFCSFQRRPRPLVAPHPTSPWTSFSSWIARAVSATPMTLQ